MPVLCTACGTENREAAQYCRGCGLRLAVAGPASGAAAGSQSEDDWARTQPMALADERTVILEQPLAPSTPPATLSPAPTMAASPGSSRVPTLLIGLVALLVAGALLGDWFFGRKSGAPPDVVAAPPAPPPAAAVVATPPPPPAPEAPLVALEAVPSPPATVPVVEPASPPEAVAAPSEAVVAPGATPSPPVAATTAAPKPQKEPRKEARPRIPPKVATPAAVEPAPAVAAPATPAPAAPEASCAGRNFIARARCMAAECAKPGIAAHPQCEAVRQQQRLEEEKRNPTLAN